MAKRQIHFSNRLEELLTSFKKNLYDDSSKVFDKRLLIVPHLGLKSYIMQELAKDPKFQVAAGIEVVNLSQGFAKLTKKKLPGKTELSFFLQHELISLIDSDIELKKYFQKENREKRIGPFCDVLAKYFLRYAIFGKKTLPGWQETLWKKWNWDNHSKLFSNNGGKIHLFGFSFIPKIYFDFFAKAKAALYLFSPCEIFWGDFYSEKEKSSIRKEVPLAQLDFFEESFEDQNPLLASWGKVGRMFHLFVEESGIPTQETYFPAEEPHCLGQLQRDMLSGSSSKASIDESLSFISASSLQREVEICKDQILELCDRRKIPPKEIQVFAPDISPYIPYIHANFLDIPYGISEVPLIDADPIAKAFLQMLNLPKDRFALEDVLQVLVKLSKFKLDLSLIRKWCEKGSIRWGGSEKKREIFYLRDFEKEQILENTPIGTWDYGLKQLLLGLASYDGIQAINPAEISEFNKLYQLLTSLDDDLAPLYDGTCFTIPTWFRYLACLLETYFDIDPAHDLYKELLKTASESDHLDKEMVPYEGVERVLSKAMHQSFQPPHLQAVRFGSLSEGCLLPSKAILLIGMQEGAFPRTEDKNSLYVGVNDFSPSAVDQDRYLFLQALCFARDFFSLSYIRDSKGDLGPSYLIEELAGAIDGAAISHHPASSYDREYFGGKFKSYNKRAFQIAQGQEEKKHNPPLIPSFFQPTPLTLAPLQPMEIEVQKLIKFAKHPLRYYFHEILGIHPEWNKKKEPEYVLDPLTRDKIVREALQRPLAEIIQEREAELPVHLSRSLAIRQIKEEVEEWNKALQELGVEIKTKKIATEIGPVSLRGKLDFFTDKGLLVKGKDQLEDKIKYWPLALIMKQFDLPVIFSEDLSEFVPEGRIEDYLAYFQLAQTHPSPCAPSLAKALFRRELGKGLKQIDDEIFDYLSFRDPDLKPEVIQNNWADLLETIFGGILANV